MQGGNFYNELRGKIVGMGGLAFGAPRVVLTTPDTLSQSDFMVCTNLTVAGAVALTLPSGTGVGQTFWIKDLKRDAGANNITITPAAGETIEGSATLVLSTNGAAVWLYKATSTAWVVLSS